jgi:hypothetical protein
MISAEVAPGNCPLHVEPRHPNPNQKRRNHPRTL